jgi:tetratricopeptide (TPR) repeat protein
VLRLLTTLAALAAPLLPLQPDGRSAMAERVQALTRDSQWKEIKAIPVKFATHHPQGMVKIGDALFVSSVEIKVRTTRFAKPPDANGLDRDAGEGVGHLFKMDAGGGLVADMTLGEGSIYHPGGIDFDGKYIWVPVAEYRPDSRSIIYRVDPATMTATAVLRFADHIGAIVRNVDDGTLHGVSWGSRRFYRWALDANGLVADANRSPDSFRTLNPSHYVDYQDCKYAGRKRMVCTGVTEIRRAGESSAAPFRLGGLDLVDLEDGRPLHQVPILLWTRSGLDMTHNPVWLEAFDEDRTGEHIGGLRAYFMPEDDKSTLYVYEVRTAVQVDSKAAVQERLKKVGAELYTRTDRYPDLVRELKEILAIDPGSAEAHMFLGVAYRGIGTPELLGEAIAELRQALAVNPGLLPARLFLAQMYMDLGRTERAREELEAGLEQAPGNPQFLAQLGEAERQLKNPKRSVDLLRRALQADGSFAQARYYLALALFDLGQRADATAELELVVKAGVKVADVYVSLGTLYLEARRFDEALEILSQATHIDSARPDIRIQLARAYRLKGLLAKAEEQLTIASKQSAAALASPFAQQQQAAFDLYVELGLLTEQQGQLQRAAEFFQKALDMDPGHADAKRHLAEVKRKLAQKPTRKRGGDR